MSIENHYLFVLGSRPILSRCELYGRVTEVLYDPMAGLLLGKDPQFKNPRNLPRDPEQLFLDQLGGTIRMAKVLGEFTLAEAEDQMAKRAKEINPEYTLKLGISGFGMAPNQVFALRDRVKGALKEQGREVRSVRGKESILSSADLFQERIPRRGVEFILWRRDNTVLLAQTVANQNLRNYTLRDHRKPFRDAHMGMLSPKLGQILINLAAPKEGEWVIDPFCGSGTINNEAAVMGYPTVGSDIDAERVAGAKENTKFLAEKFRFETKDSVLFTADATKFPWERYTGVVATEGWLGPNFTASPHPVEQARAEQTVWRMWQKFFARCTARRVVLCLPLYVSAQGAKKSIREKIFAKGRIGEYNVVALFGQPSFTYARAGAHTEREIVVLERA